MSKRIVDVYKENIRGQYRVAKEGTNSDYLIQPSPARLRDLCLLLHEKGLSKTDEAIFCNFFIAESDTLRSKIKNLDLGKLKPVQRFLLSNSELSAIESINLAAAVVDFQPRPFLRFKDKIVAEDPKLDKSVPQDQNETEPEKTGSATADEVDRNPAASKAMDPNKRNRFAFYIIVGIIMLLACIGVIAMSIRPQCMKWNEVQYEEVNCNVMHAVPYDESAFKIKKVYPSDTTTFFRNGKPIIWYSKQNNKVEFFTYHGQHPVTGTTLKAVTRHIVEKYGAKGRRQ